MGAVLLFGLLIGMKHAMEADHVAAMASLTARSRGLGETLRLGLAWGLGHWAALFGVGAVVLSLDTALPEQVARFLELMVGVMLLALGADVIRRAVRDRIHFHVHMHGDGIRHVHAHSHAGESAHDDSRHEHRHGLPLRALAVGVMHGLAGSAALLLLLAASRAESLWLGLGYLALFGLGSMVGMAALSLAIALPLRHMARPLTLARNALSAAVGALTAGLGAWTIYAAASFAG